MGTFRSTTMLWEVTANTDVLATDSPNLTTAWVHKIVYVPTTKDHAVTFQDSASATAFYLKAGATDASPVHIDFGDRGRRINGLKCSAISSGTAYVYLK
jgi:hypothetical protein